MTRPPAEHGLQVYIREHAPPGWKYSVVQLWDYPEPAILRVWEKAPECEWLLLIEVEGKDVMEAWFAARRRLAEILQERRGF